MAMPVYAMSCFKLPVYICQNITSAMMDYWWNSSLGRNKIHWVSWDKLTLPKDAGGMAFRDLVCSNQALLAKQVWRLLHEPNSLFAQLFKSRYYPHGDILSAATGASTSYAWKSFLFGRDLLVKGLRRVIGDGKDTRLWLDNWIFDGQNRRPHNKETFFDLNLHVDCLIDPVTRNWNFQKMHELLLPRDISILSRLRPVTVKKDFFCWSETVNGIYSVKSGYKLSSNIKHQDVIQEAELQPSLNALYESCWKVKAPSKVSQFLWRVLKGSLAVGDMLQNRGMHVSGGCSLCDFPTETINHIFFECPFARLVWTVARVPEPCNGYGGYVFSNMSHMLQVNKDSNIPEEIRTAIPWLLWYLWKNRNLKVFESKSYDAHALVEKALEETTMWLAANLRQDPSLDPQLVSLNSPSVSSQSWQRPSQGEVKCNIGFSWSKKHHVSGASWVVRDAEGAVLFHSRRGFSNVTSHLDAQLRSWEWAVESMHSLNVVNVVFAASTSTLIQALQNPNEWPALIAVVACILWFTSNKPFWFVSFEHPRCNKGAYQIARSALSPQLGSSYVKRGPPIWLSNLFAKECQDSASSSSSS